jgi:hypothetical protein
VTNPCKESQRPGHHLAVTMAVTAAPFQSLLSLLVLQHQYSSFSFVKVWAAHTTCSVTPRLAREDSRLRPGGHW